MWPHVLVLELRADLLPPALRGPAPSCGGRSQGGWGGRATAEEAVEARAAEWEGRAGLGVLVARRGAQAGWGS